MNNQTLPVQMDGIQVPHACAMNLPGIVTAAAPTYVL
jgi:hypothetical protein